MGHMVAEILEQRGIECAGVSEDIRSFDPALACQSVVIDFTTPAAIRENYKYLADNFKAVVIGTTGWDDMRDEIIAYFENAGTPMVYASNFSIGVNLFFATVDRLTKLMAETGGYDPYIVEMHHCHKLDAPSGTAKSLAEIVDRNLGTHVQPQSVRCGEIPGIHIVGLEGDCDRIVLKHEAFSRRGFAQGAVLAAIKADNLQGVWRFQDLILD